MLTCYVLVCLSCSLVTSCARERSTSSGDEPIFTTWQTEIGGVSADQATNSFQTDDGGYLITGVTYSTGTSGVFVLKLDSTGQAISHAIVGGQGSDWLSDACLLRDGNYILAGVDRSNTASDRIYAIVVDRLGEVLLDTAIGPSSSGARAVEATADGGILFAGLAQHTLLLLKIDYNMTVEWSQSPKSSVHAQPNGVANTSDSGFVVVGEEGAFGGGNVDAFVFRTNRDGRVSWWRHIDISSYDGATDVVATPDGSFIVCGGSVGNAFLVKLGSNGRIVWLKTYGENAGAIFDKLTLLPDGDILVSGATQGAASGGVRAWLLRFDPDFNLRWESILGAGDVYSPVTSVPTIDGGYLVVGTSHGKVYVAKTEELGKVHE